MAAAAGGYLLKGSEQEKVQYIVLFLAWSLMLNWSFGGKSFSSEIVTSRFSVLSPLKYIFVDVSHKFQ